MTERPLSPDEWARLREILWEDRADGPDDAWQDAWQDALRGALGADDLAHPHGDAPLADLLPEQWPATALEPSDLLGHTELSGPEQIDDGDGGDWTGGLFDVDPSHGETESPDHHDAHGFHEGNDT